MTAATDINAPLPIPAGMTEVTQERFYELLKADTRDIMPTHNHERCSTWETPQRYMWGWSFPGWRNPMAPVKIYAVKNEVLK